MIMPGVQNPHWRPCFSQKAVWSGWSSPLVAIPSIVVTFAPSAWTASIVQLLTALPSTWIVQAPHWLVSQPTWVPVRSRSSRSAWTSSRRGSTSSSRGAPLTVMEMCSPTGRTSFDVTCGGATGIPVLPMTERFVPWSTRVLVADGSNAGWRSGRREGAMVPPSGGGIKSSRLRPGGPSSATAQFVAIRPVRTTDRRSRPPDGGTSARSGRILPASRHGSTRAGSREWQDLGPAAKSSSGRSATAPEAAPSPHRRRSPRW